MDGFPSGQRGQTVNLLQIASVVRIHLHPFGICTPCWCGGIGRRKGLKILREQSRAGSSPATSSRSHETSRSGRLLRYYSNRSRSCYCFDMSTSFRQGRLHRSLAFPVLLLTEKTNSAIAALKGLAKPGAKEKAWKLLEQVSLETARNVCCLNPKLIACVKSIR